MRVPAPVGPLGIIAAMPIYEYRCRNGHEFEVFQSMSDDPVEVCEVCGAPVERVFRPVAVHFKGSGFYTTDYARKTKTSSSDGNKDSSSSNSESKSSEKDKKPAKASSSGKDD
jgi:putative FmdB family regulatory protein